jgi:hypothetical protein
VRAFGVDTVDDGATVKGVGYGRPVRIRLRTRSGEHRELVLHTASPNQFGHDRRSDRAAEMLLAYDTFGDIPKHVPALDVGAIMQDGSMLSLAEANEMFVLTEYADGVTYADDLRVVAHDGHCRPGDIERAAELGHYLAALHVPKAEPDHVYKRAVRDLLGSGEGIFGIVDGYPDTIQRPRLRQLQRIEERCLEWRWRLRDTPHRLFRIHGDFHPFNILFEKPSRVHLLDASRGCAGDPADDLTALSINYLFFALNQPGSWRDGFAPLWHTFWDSYFARRRDDHLLDVAPPYFAWRALVLSNPRWYPATSPEVRDALLGLCERVLELGKLDLDQVEELFR